MLSAEYIKTLLRTYYLSNVLEVLEEEGYELVARRKE